MHVEVGLLYRAVTSLALTSVVVLMFVLTRENHGFYSCIPVSLI